MAFVRCSKRRGGTPTGERAAISARRAEARFVDYASAGVPPSFFLFLSCFLLGFAGLDRDQRPDSTAGFAPRSLESRRFVQLAACLGCRPHRENDDAWSFRQALSHLAADVSFARTESPLSSGKGSVVQDKEEGALKCVFGRPPRLAAFSWRCVAAWREAIPTNAGMHSITIIRPRATFPVRCAITDSACPTPKVTMTALLNSRRCIPPRTISNPRCRNIKINALIDARHGLSARDRRAKG